MTQRTTPNRGYEVPNIGDDWDLVWQDVVDDLDGNAVYNGDGVERDIFVIPPGGSTPSAADPEDIIFEEQ
jgi:hypothetical protein